MLAWLKLLSPAAIAGIAVSLALGILLVIQKGETRHWHKQSDRYELLYTQEQAALAGTIANYRAAAEAARAADQANAARVKAEQGSINERTAHDYQARIADARARAGRVRSAQGSTNSGGAATTPMPGVSAAAGGAAQGAGQDGLSQSDALTATEQAIQLDELIKWVRKQAAVDVNGGNDAK